MNCPSASLTYTVMIVHDKNKSKVALNAEANRIRLDKDMRTLLTLFKALTKQESGDDNASPLSSPPPLTPTSIITAFLESFSSKSSAQLCFKTALGLVEKHFGNYNLLSCHPSDDAVARLGNYRRQRPSAYSLFNGKKTALSNLKVTYGSTLIAASFVLLQWHDDALSALPNFGGGGLGPSQAHACAKPMGPNS